MTDGNAGGQGAGSSGSDMAGSGGMDQAGDAEKANRMGEDTDDASGGGYGNHATDGAAAQGGAAQGGNGGSAGMNGGSVGNSDQR